MSLSWINVNKKLLEAVQVINTTPDDVFESIISHGNGEFSEKELNIYKNQLEIDDNAVQLLTQSIHHILNKSGKFVFRPNELQQQLEKVLEIDPTKAELFVKRWMEVTKEEFGDLGKIKGLNHLKWEINLETHSSLSNTEIAKAKARIQFNSTDKVQTINMDQNDLLQFYSVLENIQSKLDSLIH